MLRPRAAWAATAQFRPAVRERFVGVRDVVDFDKTFKGDQVLAALDSPVTDP
jgi:hypothetical protein